MNPSRHPRKRGAALIIALFFVVLISVVTLGYLGSARTERSTAGSHFERMRATALARDGVESVVAILRRETTDPDRNWSSQPGALIVPDPPPADPKQLRRQIPLSSGAPSTSFLATQDARLDLEPAELNVQTLTDQNPPTYLITDRRDATTGAPAQMKLRWIYVRKNGGTDLDASGLPIETPSRTNKANPIVGRFAYWTDDESSRINYNLAWKRNTASTIASNSNDAPAAHPSRINLMALTVSTGAPLTEFLADSLHNWTAKTPGRFFNSFADARQVSPEIARVLDYNKFELTHFNHDPDTTFFGEDRILLTMNPKLVPKNADGTYARKFLDIVREKGASDPNAPANPDPGILEHLAGGQPDWTNANGVLSKAPLVPNKLDAVVRMLMDYISRKNWPLAPGVSFKDKYYPGTPDSDGRLGQIAVNIIDYVRAKESQTQIIAPLRFAIGPPNASGDNKDKFTLHPSYTYGAANSYQGICRAPYITEMGFWIEANASDPPTPKPPGWPNDSSGAPAQLYKCYFKTELYLPPKYGFENVGIDLVPDLIAKPATTSTGWFITATETRDPKSAKYYYKSPNGQMVLMENHGTNAVRIFKADVQGGEGPNGTTLNAGKYVTVTATFYRDKKYADRTTIATRGALYNGLTGSDGLLAGDLNRWPRVNIGTQVGNINYKTSDPASTTIDNMVSIEVDDPRCNIHPSDWVLNKNGRNTFGSLNSVSTIGLAPTKSPAGKPQQDTDENGKVSDYSLYMPPPKGIGSNDPTHDNGRVTSIAELGYIHTGNDAKVGSIPWRTIRLQPNNYPDAKTLPDWAFMDLFAAPSAGVTGPEAIFTPHGTAVGGRINVNSHVDPFPTLIRNRGLVALFTGSSNLPAPGTAAIAETIAANIFSRTLATGSNKGKVYGYPWKVSPTATEPNAFDTPGEICEIKGVADAGEKSEDLVRDVASLITARGNVFGVYTIGQALRQTPNGQFIVTAEQRQQAVVERYHDNRGTPEPEDDEVRFRTIYFRNLTP